MKGFRFYLLTSMVAAAMVLFAAPSYAQSPEGQLGIQAGTGGFGLQYAITPGLHIGATAGVIFGDVSTQISLFPYAKFLLKGQVKPYIIAGLAIGSVEGQDADLELQGGFGLEYFINRNVGVFGDIKVIGLALDPTVLAVGPHAGGRAGLEWFFNK